MDTVKTCPACHKDNKPEAAICAFCGAPLMSLLPAVTTEPVPDLPLKITPPEHIVQLTKLYADMVVLVVLGQEQPILLRGGGKTILGRYSPGEAARYLSLPLESPLFNSAKMPIKRPKDLVSQKENYTALTDPEWQHHATQFCTLSSEILCSSNGTIAREYLLSRGLTDSVIREAQLGYIHKVNNSSGGVPLYGFMQAS